MRPTLRSNGSGGVARLCAGCLVTVALLSLVAGCVGSNRQRDYTRLYRIVPGEEREDFARLAAWIADHDGQITLPVGGTIHWAETAYYRWFSNETFVILTCPRRFHESRSFVRWVYGSVIPEKRGVGWALSGDYGIRGPGTYDFPGVAMRTDKAQQDGVFGAHFGDGRERLLRLQKWHVSDQPIGNQIVASRLNENPTDDCFVFNWLRGYSAYFDMHLFLTQDRRVGIISIRMPNSPSLAGLDFMKEDPPILRKGSFVVDESLAAKGLRQRPPVTKPRAEASEDHR